MEERRYFPLTVITNRLSELLQPAIMKQFWVKAEIASGRERGGAFYCDLVETGANGKIVAKIACNIWQRELAGIRSLFRRRNMDLVLADGTVVGFQCSLQFSPQYGLSLRVIDADPSIALGELELKKREIIERLQKEGLFEPNKQRFVPMLPQKIGLVTSNGSAAYNDFIKTLTASGFGFKVYLADALMQGEKTEKSVLLAIETLCQLKVELIVIARGGGSKTDLYYLDNEAIARKIAGCNLPVWTGIGHEIDTSVLDHVANKSFKTPTAAAEELVARFVQMRRQLDESINTLKTVWAYRLKMDREHLDQAKTGIHQGTRKLLDVTIAGLRERAQELNLRVKGRLSTERIRIEVGKQKLRSQPIGIIHKHKERLASKRPSLESKAKFLISCAVNTFSRLKSRFQKERFLQRLQSERKSMLEKMATLKAADPQIALKRGFALVYRPDGKLIRSINDITEKEKICTHLADGSLISEVTSKEEKHE